MRARIFITLKHGVLDPQGKAVENGLHSLGFSEAENVRLGKYIELDVSGSDVPGLKKRVEQMCERLLANTVVENYRVELDP